MEYLIKMLSESTNDEPATSFGLKNGQDACLGKMIPTVLFIQNTHVQVCRKIIRSASS